MDINRSYCAVIRRYAVIDPSYDRKLNPSQ
jgi:hypothetical protein